MPLKFRLDLGLGNQPLKLGAIIIGAWVALSVALFHDRLTGPWDATTRDVLILLAVPPVVVMALVGMLRVLGGGRS